MTFEILQRLGLALAIGLLIGVERAWREREGAAGSRAAGIRTHALIGLLGGLMGLLGQLYGDVVLGFGAFAFILVFAAFEWREEGLGGSVSATGLVAGILAFVFGVYAVKGDMLAAAAAGVVTTLILAEREMLHGFVKRLKWVELRSAILLLVMSVVLLPVLPNTPVDPWNAINPFQVWLATVLIAALSYAGYIAVQLAGPKTGPLYAGVAGGLVSSTVVTWTLAQLAGKQKTANRPLAAAIVASWIVSLVRTAAVAIAIAPALFVTLAPPIAAAIAVFVVAGAWLYWQGVRAPSSAAIHFTSPFELWSVIRFGVLIAAILLLTKAITSFVGAGGLFALAAVSGLADVDPITISTAQNVGVSLDAKQASLVVLTAAFANLLTKCGLTFYYGKAAFAWPPLLSAAMAVLAAGAFAFLA